MKQFTHRTLVYVPQEVLSDEEVQKELIELTNQVGGVSRGYVAGIWQDMVEDVSVYEWWYTQPLNLKPLIQVLFKTQQAVLVVENGSAWLYERGIDG